MTKQSAAALALAFVLGLGALPSAHALMVVQGNDVLITDGMSSAGTLTYNFSLISGPYNVSLVDTSVVNPFSSLGLDLRNNSDISVGSLGAPGSFTFTSLYSGAYKLDVTGTPGNPLSLFGVTIAAIPEPEIWAMTLVGSILVGLQLRRKRNAADANRLG